MLLTSDSTDMMMMNDEWVWKFDFDGLILIDINEFEKAVENIKSNGRNNVLVLKCGFSKMTLFRLERLWGCG